MLGDRRKADASEFLHPGSTPKFKGHECGVMIRFCLHSIRVHGLRKFSRELSKAAESMVELLEIIRTSPDDMPVASSQRLMEVSIEALVSMQIARVIDAPKAHFLIHYTKRMRGLQSSDAFSHARSLTTFLFGHAPIVFSNPLSWTSHRWECFQQSNTRIGQS